MPDAPAVPHISVVIPTCERNDLLNACLFRLAPARQDFPAHQYEVIVTDDGAGTTAEELVRTQYSWAKWVAGPRRGPAANRNSGFRNAQYDLVAFTNDDCLPSPGWLKSYSRALTVDKSVYEGKTICSAPATSPMYEVATNATGGCLWSCNLMLRREAFDALGGFDEDFPLPYLEDADFRDRVNARNLGVSWVPDAVVDQPPKLRPTGAAAGATVECEVLYWYKHGKSGSPRSELVPNLFRTRMREIVGQGLGPDTFRALSSMAAELSFVRKNIGRWDDKYRTKYAQQGVSAQSSGV